jgi:homoserine acetyltransferase
MTCIRRGYRTLGKLNAEKSNAILWPTWLGGRSEELLQFIGPGNVVDSGKYFVILVDSIGNGISTSPFNSSSQPRMKFPKFTVRDMVESEHRLVTEVLRLGHLHAVMGLSMGVCKLLNGPLCTRTSWISRFLLLLQTQADKSESPVAPRLIFGEALQMRPQSGLHRQIPQAG